MLVIKKVKLMSTKILTTAERYKEDGSKGSILIKTSGSIKEYQKVVEVGPMVRGIEVGDLVMINPVRYVQKKYDNSVRDDMDMNPTVSVNIPVVEVNNVPHFMIDQCDVDYVISEYEEQEDVEPSPIIKPMKANFDNPIIGTDKKIML